MLQIGSVGPMFGQLNHFKRYAPEKISYAIERYEKHYDSMGFRSPVGRHEFICGDYSIADIATYPGLLSMNFKV